MNHNYVSVVHGNSLEALKPQINFNHSALLLVYFGSNCDYKHLYSFLKKQKVPFIGSMDTGRLFNNSYLLEPDSIVVMSLSKEVIKKVQVVSFDMRQSVSHASIKSVSGDLFHKALTKMNINLINPNLEKTFAINLLYGLNSANPVLEAQTDVSLYFQTVGGSSGGKLDFKNAPVISSQGYGNIGTTAVIELEDRFFFRTDLTTSFQKLEGSLKVTDLKNSRHIAGLNGNNAVSEYAKLIGLREDELSPSVFAAYSLGMETGDGERLITSIQKPDGAGGFLTYNDVVPDTVFTLYKAVSQYEYRKKKIERVAIEGTPIAYISFDCVLCYLARNTLNEVDTIGKLYSEILPDVPKIGFGTFGENYCGANVNQTETFLMILEK
jgi:hypothetical protein